MNIYTVILKRNKVFCSSGKSIDITFVEMTSFFSFRAKQTHPTLSCQPLLDTSLSFLYPIYNSKQHKTINVGWAKHSVPNNSAPPRVGPALARLRPTY
jgi:hypothetical protein